MALAFIFVDAVFPLVVWPFLLWLLFLVVVDDYDTNQLFQNFCALIQGCCRSKILEHIHVDI
jgi:hypothetical protein